MSKLAIALVLVASIAPAYADVVEPTSEPQPEPAAEPEPTAKSASAETRIMGPSMVAPRTATDDEEQIEGGTPPLSSGRVMGEFLLGGVFAVGGALGGA